MLRGRSEHHRLGHRQSRRARERERLRLVRGTEVRLPAWERQRDSIGDGVAVLEQRLDRLVGDGEQHGNPEVARQGPDLRSILARLSERVRVHTRAAHPARHPRERQPLARCDVDFIARCNQ